MKKIISVIFILIIILSITGCKKSDAISFKEEYEKLNGTKSESGKTIRTISIDKNNPMIYKTEDDIVEMINNKETFIVYFGFAKCPWCRSILPNLLKVAKDLNINKIYYVDILNIRDTQEINEEGEIITTKKGTNGYYELLKIFDNVLEAYTLTNEKKEEINSHEKRIYAPNIISVVKGKAEGFTTGISDDQSDGYMKLTNKMNKDSYDKIKCSVQCVVNSKNVCSPKGIC